MAEKIYDYSNKHSYDGVAPKENEALVPFLAHEVLKNYHQDVRDGIRKRNEGIIEDTFETWNIRGRKILVGFTAIPKDEVESYIEGFWKEKDDYLESTRKKRCLILNKKGEYIRCPKCNKCEECNVPKRISTFLATFHWISLWMIIATTTRIAAAGNQPIILLPRTPSSI